jgi:tRNA splicing endonuclease
MDKYQKLAVRLVGFANYLADKGKLTVKERGRVARALRRAELMNSNEPSRQQAKRRNYQVYKNELQRWSDELSEE